jgi:hypothetical protein
MQLDELILIYSFSEECFYNDFNKLIIKSGHHTYNDFEQDLKFAVLNKDSTPILLNSNQTWILFGTENQPFRIQGLEGEYILKFTCEDEIYFNIITIVKKYWFAKKEPLGCSIFAVEEKKPSDPFNWRPKRIEIQNYRY